MTGINCPCCNKDDMVQKVTAIVESETNITSGYSVTSGRTVSHGNSEIYTRSGNNEKYTGRAFTSGSSSTTETTNTHLVQRSSLAAKLLPPMEPKSPQKPKLQDSIFFTWVILFLIVSLVGLGVTFPFASGRLDSAVLILASPIAGIFVCYVLYILTRGRFGEFLKGTAIKIYMSIWGDGIQKQFENDKREYELASQKYHTELLAYQQAFARWKKAFYCRRCDNVFLPGEAKYVSPNAFYELLLP